MSVLALSSALDPDHARFGGKAAGIVQMLKMEIPVPPAFVITTDECTRYQQSDGTVPNDVIEALPEAISHLELSTGMTFGSGPKPLLVSVRSGAPTSMPGMMDTVLNLGINSQMETALASLTGNAEFARDVHSRFKEQFEEIVGQPAPSDPMAQLTLAIDAVFASWNSDRAIAYRKDRKLSDTGGTAVTVQAMVFGNLDTQSGTGVLFSRNPFSGTGEPFGEWLPRGQGEDVVSGRLDPQPVSELHQQLPAVHGQLMMLAEKLERTQLDVQDIEFTVQSGKLWLLQTRAAKRSAIAGVRLAVLLAKEGIISKEQALSRVTPEHISLMKHPHIEPSIRAEATVLATGQPASPGVVQGIAVSDTEEAEDRALDGEDIILVRQTTNPDDVRAMTVVKGIATEIGGATSHAAVVSRELDVACVVGCGDNSVTPLNGQAITVDANSGEVLAGQLPLQTSDEQHDKDLATLHQWATQAAGHDAPLQQLLAAEQTTA